MKISLVVPAYNEEEAIPLFYQAVSSYEPLKAYDLEIVFVNDGSQDRTESLINELAEKDPRVVPLSFMRNFGKEAALMAGLNYATGDAVIPMDVDLQDPVEVVPKLIAEWEKGADVVLAKRTDRSADSFLKRKTAEWFYRFNNRISDLKIEENVGDFRLMDRFIVDQIKQLPERNLFMKGILSWVGGTVAIVPYKRPKRSVGKTRFNGWKLWNLALEGITNFSTVLLHIWFYIGMVIATVALLYGLDKLITKVLYGNPVPGYTSLIVSILFIGGIQLVGLGIMGEYIGRIYLETKRRPRYVLKASKYTKRERGEREK
jgi:polyisoprenyl-phosphate glycosyltransferase